MMNMVRILAGTLVEVGRGRLTPDELARPAVASAGERRDAGMTAPRARAHAGSGDDLAVPALSRRHRAELA